MAKERAGPPRDRVGGVDGPDEFPLTDGPPPQVAARPHQRTEDLRPMAGVKHDKAHSLQKRRFTRSTTSSATWS